MKFITDTEINIPSITGLVTTATQNSKATKIVNKTLNIVNPAAKAASIAKQQRLRGKCLILLIWVAKLLSVPKLQKLRV